MFAPYPRTKPHPPSCNASLDISITPKTKADLYKIRILVRMRQTTTLSYKNLHTSLKSLTIHPFNDPKLGGSGVYTDLTISRARHVITIGEYKKLQRLGSLQWNNFRKNYR
jgi:hypothetical protein